MSGETCLRPPGVAKRGFAEPGGELLVVFPHAKRPICDGSGDQGTGTATIAEVKEANMGVDETPDSRKPLERRHLGHGGDDLRTAHELHSLSIGSREAAGDRQPVRTDL